jgi:type II secretory ATPase GspE/PulE/Tfp pilus assembly ATPase PilB-like protein
LCHGEKKENVCQVCLGSGFYGRHGLYELMVLSSSIRKQISMSPEAALLEEIACREGMQKLTEHGKELVEANITTPEEVWRVTRGGDVG